MSLQPEERDGLDGEEVVARDYLHDYVAVALPAPQTFA
jgi:hypothetical protein